MFIGTEKLTHIYMPGTPYATKALSEVSFSLSKGEFVLLIGPSGSGKSTLIQHFNGLLQPTAGQVFYDGRAVGVEKAELLILRRRIGLVFQIPEEQFFSESVYDEVAFAPRNLGLSENDVRNRVKDALEKVGLNSEQLQNRHPFQLSAGQKRLVAIAAVLSLNPEVFILDEPAAGLDPAGRKNLYRLLAYLNRKTGLTVIVSTHRLDDAAELADRVIALKGGRLVLSGLAVDIFARRAEIEELGMDLPAVTEIMYGLTEKGLPVRTDIYDLKKAREEIRKLMGWNKL